MCVLPGQAVPVATRGIFSLGANSFGGGTLTGNNLYVGSGIKLSATQGNITGCLMSDAGKIGTILGTGTRTSQTTTDQFAGDFVVIGLRM
jgi:hypothetical protein